MAIRYPDINGVRTSFASIELNIWGAAEAIRLRGIRSINYRDTGDIPKIRGASGTPIGRVRGESDTEGDIEIYQKEWDELLPILTRNGLFGYMETVNAIAVTYSDLLDNIGTKTDRLDGVRFYGADRSNSEGGDALTVKLSLSIMEIAWHGRYTALRVSP
jgi:hypothetical protein